MRFVSSRFRNLRPQSPTVDFKERRMWSVIDRVYKVWMILIRILNNRLAKMIIEFTFGDHYKAITVKSRPGAGARKRHHKKEDNKIEKLHSDHKNDLMAIRDEHFEISKLINLISCTNFELTNDD